MLTIGQEVYVLGDYLPRKAIVSRLSDGPARPYYLLEVHPEPLRLYPQRLEYTGYLLGNIHLTLEAARNAQREENRELDSLGRIDKLRRHYGDLYDALLELETT